MALGGLALLEALQELSLGGARGEAVLQAFPSLLRIRSAFPALWEAEGRGGSVIRGFLKKAEVAGPRPPRHRARTLNFRGGLKTLPETLERALGAMGAEIVVSVSDRGPGVSEGQRQLIFHKFVRGREAGQTAGAGLGLAICQAIVAAHGGRIWVEPRPGGGSIFRFALPKGQEPPATSEGTPA